MTKGRVAVIYRKMASVAQGFTTIELVVTMIIIGIMAVVALPRFGDIGLFDARGAADQLASYLRFAQKSALAQRRNVRVVVDGNVAVAPRLCIAANPGDACPAACASSNLVFPGGFSVPRQAVAVGGAGTFCFDTLGGASATQTITFSSDGGLVRTIKVEAVTGFVHAS